eukprot:7272082-Alexandrium_andersonii.AAC.1
MPRVQLCIQARERQNVLVAVPAALGLAPGHPQGHFGSSGSFAGECDSRATRAAGAGAGERLRQELNARGQP